MTAQRTLLALLMCGSFACEARTPEPRFTKELPQARQEEAPGQVARDKRQAQPKTAAPQQAPTAPRPASIQRYPNGPDPIGGKFTLDDATKGLPKKGTLRATIETGAGTIECTLYADKTPNTVANFVGLARGLRPFWDPRSSAWVKRPLYDGTSFHRCIPDFMIQGGDHLGDGTGQVGYEIPDEIVGLKHDRAGLLCMANRGPNTNGGQFFITDAAAPHLTQMGTYTIFGECTQLDVIHSIARAPRSNPGSERPEPVVPITKIIIKRK